MVYHGHCHFNAVGKTRCPLYNIDNTVTWLITFPEVLYQKTMLVK
jgi:hypothetical protein